MLWWLYLIFNLTNSYTTVKSVTTSHAKEKPKAIALRLISEVFGHGDLSNLKFVYYPKRYRGLQSLQDVLSVFYKNKF